MVSKTATPEQKSASAKYQQEWRAKNYQRWREICNAANEKYKQADLDRNREGKRTHRYAVRREIFDLLGGQRCVHCSYDKDWRALQVDHVNGGGKHDSKTSGGNTNLWAFRNWLKDNPQGWQGIYQVLCANCNWIKRFENGEHPGGVVKREA